MSESDDILDIIRDAGEYALGQMGEDLRRVAEEDRPKITEDLRRLAVLGSRWLVRPAQRAEIEGESHQLTNGMHFVLVRYGLDGTVMARTFIERLFGYLAEKGLALVAKL